LFKTKETNLFLIIFEAFHSHILNLIGLSVLLSDINLYISSKIVSFLKYKNKERFRQKYYLYD